MPSAAPSANGEAAVRAAARHARPSGRLGPARDGTLTRWIPRPRLMPGALAARRRREVAVTIAILLALNLLVWIVRPDWESRLAAASSLLVAPSAILFVRQLLVRVARPARVAG